MAKHNSPRQLRFGKHAASAGSQSRFLYRPEQAENRSKSCEKQQFLRI